MRTYKRKTDRGKASVELLDKAYDAVKTGLSIREAAKSHELCHVTLSRFIKKRKGKFHIINSIT